MRRKYIMERASTLSTSSAEGKPFIVSSAKAELPAMEVAAFGCNHCKAEFASNKALSPFCVNCGSDDVKPIVAKVQTLPATDAALCSIGCRSCGTNNVLSSETATALDGKMHCVECGGQLSYDADDLERPVEDADADDIDKTMSGEKAKTISGDDRGGLTDNSPITDADADDIADALPTTQVAKTAVVATEPENNVVPTAPTGEAPVKNEPTSPTDAPTTELDEDALIEHAATGEDGDEEFDDEGDQQSACEYTKASLAAVVLAKNPKAALTLATSDDEILAFADGVPVARLEKSGAKPEHAKVFHTRPFTKSIEHLASTKGLRSALAAYNFTAIKVDFPIGAVNRAQATAALREATAKIEETASTHQQDFMQCLSLAATSLNKNLYRKRASVLKAGFIELLSSTGVKNARVLVERVFAASGDAYHQQVFELAQELQTKPLDFRNTLAESLSDMNVMDGTEYDGMPNEDTQEVEIESASALDQHMENAAFAAASTNKSSIKRSVITASAPRQSIRALRSKLF